MKFYMKTYFLLNLKLKFLLKQSKVQVFALWAATSVLLSAAAVLGNMLLASVSQSYLAAIRCFAAGAVIASLATAVFPKAYREDSFISGIATALGLLLALALGELGGSVDYG